MLEPTHLERAAKLWGGRPEDLELIGEVENVVYTFPCREYSWVLRLTHSSHRSLQTLNGELDWIDYLHRNDTKVCRPIGSVNGRLVEKIPAQDGYFCAVVFEHIRGGHLDGSHRSDAYRTLLRNLGRTIGRMHRLTKDYVSPTPENRRHYWHEDDLFTDAPKYLARDGRNVVSLVEQQMSQLHTLPRARDSFGLIHADVHFANVFIEDDMVTVFDFDDCSYNWFIFDLMIPIYFAMMGIPSSEMGRREETASEVFSQIITGYQAENELDYFWFEQLPSFLRVRDLQLYVWMHKNGWNQPDNQFYRFICANIEHDRPCVEVDFKKLHSDMSA